MSKFDKYLNMIGFELQIPETKFEEIKNDYNSLAEYIKNNNELADEKDMNIYYQGSFAIDTAIRPLRGDDFDVDMVLEFGMNANEMTPVKFYNYLYDTFSEGRYSDILEKHRNNIRINYKNNYHFDIMPAVSFTKEGMKLLAPNVNNNTWNTRFPKKYAEWFGERAKLIKGYQVSIRDSRYLMESITEPLVEPKPYELKPTLNRIIQLLKRARDVFFSDTDDCVPQSIVITTLAAKYYEGEYSVYDALLNITKKIKQLCDNNREFDVLNPVSNATENFTEKWHREKDYYSNFKSFINNTYNNLINFEKDGYFQKAMNSLFNNTLVDNVKSQTKYDNVWDFRTSNIVEENIFPDKKVNIDKKERGNA